MSRSYRDIPPDQYVSRRRKALEEKKRKDIIEKANVQSQLLRKIRNAETEQKAMVKALFFMWWIADGLLIRLENQRNEHRPKDKDEEWDEQFCEAVDQIPGVKRICNELWNAYSNADREEFRNWI